MKVSVLLSIAALIVAVVADPIPAEDQVAAAPQIFDEITPFLSSASDVEKRQGIWSPIARTSSIVSSLHRTAD